MLCASFREHEGAIRKIESRQASAPRKLCSSRPPVEAAGDHQVQHQPEIAFYANRNSLADPPQFAHNAAFDIRKQWLRGAKQKRAPQPYVLDRLSQDSWLKRTNVGGDIR